PVLPVWRHRKISCLTPSPCGASGILIAGWASLLHARRASNNNRFNSKRTLRRGSFLSGKFILPVCFPRNRDQALTPSSSFSSSYISSMHFLLITLFLFLTLSSTSTVYNRFH